MGAIPGTAVASRTRPCRHSFNFPTSSEIATVRAMPHPVGPSPCSDSASPMQFAEAVNHLPSPLEGERIAQLAPRSGASAAWRGVIGGAGHPSPTPASKQARKPAYPLPFQGRGGFALTRRATFALFGERRFLFLLRGDCVALGRQTTDRIGKSSATRKIGLVTFVAFAARSRAALALGPAQG